MVQPPSGHFTLQLVLPWHSTVVPLPTVSLQVLPPPHVTLLFVPVESVHSLVPVHVEVQFDWHVPSHFDWPAQFVVHPVPHVESHVFFDLQSNVALSGGPSAPPSPTPPSPPVVVAPPNTQVPPALQSHTAPVHTQSPLQLACAPATPSSPPQAVDDALATTHEAETTTSATMGEKTPRTRVGPLMRTSFAYGLRAR